MNWLKVLRSNEAPALLEALEAFENRTGIVLPTDYRDFMLNHNGGHVFADHSLPVEIEGLAEETHVECLYPLTSPPPSIGIIEFQEHWHDCKAGIEAALPIGDDGGTGFFFLMLSPRFFGNVYFAYKDEFMAYGPDWHAGIAEMPAYMGLVSGGFTDLGELIERHAIDPD